MRSSKVITTTSKPKRLSGALSRAIKNGDLKKVKSLLADKKYQRAEWLNAVNKNGNTALLLAVKYGKYDIAGWLLTLTGVNVNALNNHQQNAVNLYLYNMHKIYGDISEPLLALINHQEHVFDIEALNKAGLLIYFVDINRADVVAMLLAKGLDPNACPYNDSPLQRASGKGFLGIVEILIAHPAIQVNYLAPIIAAAKHSHLDVVIRLLAHPDIDLNHNARSWRTPLKSILNNFFDYASHLPQQLLIAKTLLSHPGLNHTWVLESRCAELIWLLTKVGHHLFTAVLNHPTTIIRKKNGPSDLVLQFEVNAAALINILLNDADFDINRRLWNGETLLTMAVKTQDESLINRLLADPRINLNAQNRDRDTALTLAETHGQHLFNLFINHSGFDIHKSHHLGKSILMLAAGLECVNLVKLLLADGRCKVNAQDLEGNTALTLAAIFHDNAIIISDLLEHGADPYLKNNEGYNAIMEAKRENHRGICHLLKAVPSAPESHAPTAPPMSVSDISLQAATVDEPPLFRQNSEYRRFLLWQQNQVSVPQAGTSNAPTPESVEFKK
jgi:ankyrin repeat protein